MREKRIKQLEKEQREKLGEKVDQICRQYVPTDLTANGFVQKPLYANIHPCSKRFDALLQGRGGTSVGNLTFKNCKRVTPLDKFNYRKRINTDTVGANKKFFTDNPHLKEFAKSGLYAGYASEMKR